MQDRRKRQFTHRVLARRGLPPSTPGISRLPCGRIMAVCSKPMPLKVSSRAWPDDDQNKDGDREWTILRKAAESKSIAFHNVINQGLSLHTDLCSAKGSHKLNPASHRNLRSVSRSTPQSATLLPLLLLQLRFGSFWSPSPPRSRRLLAALFPASNGLLASFVWPAMALQRLDCPAVPRRPLGRANQRSRSFGMLP